MTYVAIKQQFAPYVTEVERLLLDARASASEQAGKAIQLAEFSDIAGQKATNTSGQSSEQSVAPCNEAIEADKRIGKRGGRPHGAYSSLTRWLRPQIVKFKQRQYTCRNLLYSLAMTEEMENEDAFIVTDETADLYYEECFGDIRGQQPRIVILLVKNYDRTLLLIQFVELTHCTG